MSRIFSFFVKDCHVLCHGLSRFASRIVMSCFTDYHFCVTNRHVFVTDCHVLSHGLSCFVSRIVMFCVTDWHVLFHGLAFLVSRIVMFLSRVVMFCVTECHVLCHGLSCFTSLSCLVSRIVTFCVTDYLLGFNLFSTVVCINASVEHISSIFMVNYDPLLDMFTA